jgi:succinyl-diaminopimelate desuccinylase
MQAADAHAKLDEAAILAFASDLIAIPTENPPGGAWADCVARIATELKRLGLRYDLVQTGTADEPRTTIVADAGDRGPLLYLHGHLDVVPAFAPEQFEPRVERGRLRGRGASDMKGGLAAIVHAAPQAPARGVRVRLVIVPDEETGGRFGAERLRELGVVECGAAGAIVAEPTWGTIWHAARGAFTLRVRVRGRPAHVGLHYEGRNAFLDALALVSTLQPLQEALRERQSTFAFASSHPRAPESIMLVGGFAGGGANFNIVPDEFSFTIDRRPNADEDYAEAKGELLAALEAARREIEIEWEVLQDAESSLTPRDDPFVTTVADAAAQATGNPPSLTCCPGVLETRVYRAAGIPAVAFGPGLIDQMHGRAEEVPVPNLVAASKTYVAVATALGNAYNERESPGSTG